ncbi:MAG: translation elongation factor Ts [Oscillospiraceae bacterium]|jgi:elongation factor Ts|nr:translation elongation factor Ts [Oscillospiraceae bacterium]
MAFTAKDVQTLREKTGVGMMDCKKALIEANGDMAKAIDYLRERGLAAAAKKAGRIAAEGAVDAFVTENAGALVEINSETDFAAGSDNFKSFAALIAKTVAGQNPADVDALLALTPAGEKDTVQELLQEKILTIGENIKIRRFVRYEGVVASYIHGGGRIGVLVKFNTEVSAANSDAFKELSKDICMQVAAANPLFLDEAAVPAETLEYERKILTEQVVNEGKPAAIAEKIVNGKLGKYYKENCLLEQPFIKDGDITVKQHLANVSKAVGVDITVAAFARLEKGEGLQKREDNFADEVANMIK